MRDALQTFSVGISELKDYLSDAENEAALLGMLTQPGRLPQLEPKEQSLLRALARTRTDRKRYVYAVAIISLYGLLERFVDTLIERFVDRLAHFASTYADVPDIIRNNHARFSIELASAIVEDRYRGSLTAETVVANLHSCLSGASPFRLNGAAFVLHRGNITLARIAVFLNSVGISSHLRRLTYTTAFSRFFAERYPERNIREIPDPDVSRLFTPIDDLVERRNQVSHGVINVDELESVELLQERCAFVAAYGASLYELVAQDVVEKEIQTAGGQAMGKPIAVHNSSIVCFRSSACRVAVGDTLVARTRDEALQFRFSTIESIEIDHVRHQSVDIKEATDFGVMVSFRARDDFVYHILEAGVI